MFLSVLAPSCKGRRFHRIFRLMAGTAAFCLSSLPVGATEVTDGLLKRILPHGKDASRFTCVIDGSHSGKDWFAISCDGQTVSIKGPNNVSLAAGINWFLNKVGIDISWNMSKAKLPTSLPIVSEETHTSTVDYRYYLNFCTHSYTMAFWDWSRWQQEIDWMALHGINLPLITEGMECVWRKVLMDGYGYDSLDKVNKFVTGPAYFGWFFMNNMTEWGGPLPQNGMISKSSWQRRSFDDCASMVSHLSFQAMWVWCHKTSLLMQKRIRSQDGSIPTSYQVVPGTTSHAPILSMTPPDSKNLLPNIIMP